MGLLGPRNEKSRPRGTAFAQWRGSRRPLAKSLATSLHLDVFITVVGSAAFFFEMLSLLATNLLRQPQRDLWHQNDKQNNGQK